MSSKVHMEALSPTMEEGQVVKWLKSEGDEVTNGDIIAEIETDKATMELTARGDGILRAIMVGEGATAPVGSVIAVIAAADEDISASTSAAEGGNQTATSDVGGNSAASAPAEEEAPTGATPTGAAPAAPTAAPVATPGGRIKASPLAKRLAADSGLDLAVVSGSGPAGRIVKRDIALALTEGVASPVRTAVASAPASEVDYEDVSLSQMRKTIARRLAESIGPVPHFFLTIDVDMGRAMEARLHINAMLEKEGRKVSLNDLIIRATAAALRRHPACNAHWLVDSIRRFNRVHIGVAVAVEDGLITCRTGLCKK